MTPSPFRSSRWKLWTWAASLTTILGVSVAVAQVGTSSNGAECCLNASSALSSYLNPPTGEDNTFFRQAAGGDATIVFTLMNREEMRWLTRSLYEIRIAGSSNGNPDDASATGCNNSYLNGLNYFYTRNTTYTGLYQSNRTYPRPEVTYAHSAVNTNGVRNVFEDDVVYKFLGWTSSGRDTTNSYQSNTASTRRTNACNALGLNATQAVQCVTCLGMKGYYLNPNVTTAADHGRTLNANKNAALFEGNWLNFNPPRFVQLRTALKRMIGDPRIARFRIAVATNAGEDGVLINENFRPSCNGNGTPTNSFTSGIDAVPFTGTDNPLAEVLFNLGQYHADDSRWTTGGLFSGSNVRKSGISGGNLCRDCDKHFIALFSDGRGDESVPGCAPVELTDAGITVDTILDGGFGGISVPPGGFTPPGTCTRTTTVACLDTTATATLEGDNDDYVRNARSTMFGTTPVTPAGTCPADLADDVAAFLDRTDLSLASGFPAQNTVQTYVIGVGSNAEGRMAILDKIGERGGGDFYAATNYAAIESGLDDMLTQMLRRATSFSSAAVSAFQVSTGATAIIPRFRPNRTGNWEGSVYRWGLFSEFVESTDKNGDGDKDDVFLVDPQGRIVSEDEDGIFRLAPTTDGGLGAQAEAWWEAGAELATLDGGSAARTIYTVVDNNRGPDGGSAPDGLLDSRDSIIPFDEAHAADILPYLALEGSPVCNQLEINLGSTFPSRVDCARAIIRFVRGMDILDEDADSNRTEMREKPLGDIFHSSPVVVTNPVDPFLCDLGLHPQCANTLYARDLPVGATPMESYDGGSGALSAYDAWRQDERDRTRVVLVGANDGMVHAFHAGDYRDPGPDAGLFPETHDEGTGREVWAFIPPDLLPKLKFRLTGENRHHYFVDGDVAVRDIWTDTNSDGTKQKSEYRTLAVFAERRGGNHYFALDVTDTGTPTFRWLFPQPCSPEAQEVGETFMTFSPKPPPIGPILLEKPTAEGGIARAVPPGTTPVGTEERWAIFLQGGYDTNFNRGRGFYVLDAWTGDMLFKRQYRAGATNGEQNLTFPVAAPLALIDYGTGQGTSAGGTMDGFFDTALIADTGGQVHVLRFLKPGHFGTDGQVDNWYLARTFEEGSGSFDARQRNPFFFIASSIIDPITGQLRTFLGGGDRYNVRDPGVGECKVDNPLACGRRGCSYNSSLTLDTGEERYVTSTTLSQTANTLSEAVTSPGSSACMGISGQQRDVITCGATVRTVKDRSVRCGMDGGTYACSDDLATVDGGTYLTDVQSGGATIPAGNNKSRYYGFWVYGRGVQADGGVVTREFSDDTTAATFDTNRIRESALKNVTSGAKATGGDPGWYLEYPAYEERTASGSGILASCVLWNTLQYTEDAGTSSCALGGTNTARFYQANVITGAADCADSFRSAADGGYVRSQARTVLTPPPEPIAKVSMNAAGQIRYSLDSFDPGAPQATSANVKSSADVMQLIYSLDVPDSLHACRHQPTANGMEASCE